MQYIKALAILAVLTCEIPALGAEFNISTKLQSQYLAGNGAIFHDRPVIQSDLMVSFKNGIYADIWHSSSLEFDNWNRGSDDEIDYMVGWTHVFPKFNVDTGVLYMNFVDLNYDKGDGILPYLELNRTPKRKQSWSPYVKFQPAFPVKGRLPQKGYYLAGGLSSVQQQRKSGPEIRQKLSVIYDSGTFGWEENTIGEYKFELSYKFGKRTRVVFPSATAYIPLSKPSGSDGRKTCVSVGTGLTVAF